MRIVFYADFFADLCWGGGGGGGGVGIISW